MKKDCLKADFGQKINEMLKLIEPGLKKKKCLFKDGLHNLPTEIHRTLTNETEEGNCFLVMLCIMIQAYPGSSWECTDEEQLNCVRLLKFLLCSVELERHVLVKLKYGRNKLYPEMKVKVEMTEKSKMLHDKFGEDAINHLTDN